MGKSGNMGVVVVVAGAVVGFKGTTIGGRRVRANFDKAKRQACGGCGGTNAVAGAARANKGVHMDGRRCGGCGIGRGAGQKEEEHVG